MCSESVLQRSLLLLVILFILTNYIQIGITPLYLAACNGRNDVVDLLIKHGASLDPVYQRVSSLGDIYVSVVIMFESFPCMSFEEIRSRVHTLACSGAKRTHTNRGPSRRSTGRDS